MTRYECSNRCVVAITACVCVCMPVRARVPVRQEREREGESACVRGRERKVWRNMCVSPHLLFPSQESQPTAGGGTGLPSFSLACSQLKAHSADVNCVRWNPTNPNLLASAGDEGLVKVWEYVPSVDHMQVT